MPRWFTRSDNWDFGGRPGPEEESREPKSRKRRLASTFVFTVLFFAGASLAAVAGDRLTASVASDVPTSADTTTTSADPAPAAAAAPVDAAAAAPGDSATAAATQAATSHDLSAPGDPAAPAPNTAAIASQAAAAASSQGFAQVDGSSGSSQANASVNGTCGVGLGASENGGRERTPTASRVRTTHFLRQEGCDPPELLQAASDRGRVLENIEAADGRSPARDDRHPNRPAVREMEPV